MLSLYGVMWEQAEVEMMLPLSYMSPPPSLIVPPALLSQTMLYGLTIAASIGLGSVMSPWQGQASVLHDCASSG
jgi:hypothetical protein